MADLPPESKWIVLYQASGARHWQRLDTVADSPLQAVEKLQVKGFKSGFFFVIPEDEAMLFKAHVEITRENIVERVQPS